MNVNNGMNKVKEEWLNMFLVTELRPYCMDTNEPMSSNPCISVDKKKSQRKLNWWQLPFLLTSLNYNHVLLM